MRYLRRVRRPITWYAEEEAGLYKEERSGTVTPARDITKERRRSLKCRRGRAEEHRSTVTHRRGITKKHRRMGTQGCGMRTQEQKITKECRDKGTQGCGMGTHKHRITE